MLLFLLVALVIAAFAAWTDWRTGEIPNWLTFGTVILAPIAHIVFAATQLGMDRNAALLEGAYSIAGALLCALLPFLLYQKEAIGAGDVKLFAAIGALAQVLLGIEAEVYSFFAVAFIAPARLAYDGKLLRTLRNSLVLMRNSFVPKGMRIPLENEAMTEFRMGPAIVLGTLVATILHWRAR